MPLPRYNSPRYGDIKQQEIVIDYKGNNIPRDSAVWCEQEKV